MEVTRVWKDPQVRRGLGLVLIGVLVALSQGSAGGAERQPTHGTLRVVWDQELPPYPSGPARDVRWASDHTVYLAWLKEGITETVLDGKFTRLRTLVADPGRWFRAFEMLAASPHYVVTSSHFMTLAFRPAARQESGLVTITKLKVGIVEALDLSGPRLLLLGNVGWDLSPQGVIAWIGPLTAHPDKDLAPLPLYDAGGPGAPSLAHCAGGLELGHARFFADGSFLVVPGFQPGAHLFSRDGRPLRTWDTRALGIDAVDCVNVSADQVHGFASSAQARFGFINQRRVLEEILPLEEGPGLILRWVAGGKVHWELKVLQASGQCRVRSTARGQSGARVLTYQIPFTGELPYDRLRGDVQNHRIVLLRGAHDVDHVGPPFRTTHLFVAELPQGAQEGGQP